MYTFTWTIATWVNRASATYVAIDQPIDGAFIDRFGYLSTMAGSASHSQRNPYKVEQSGSTIYKTYQSGDGVVPIIKIVEA